jgi:LmbE family N-acetylglucosaminyl deacetylase
MRIISTEALPQKLLRVFTSICFLLITTSLAQSPAANSGTTVPTAPGYLDPLPGDTGTAGLKQELRKLQTTGRLMMVVAHPDDEDGGLLTLEARGKGVQTLLMTLTRGEGGQNKLGSSLFDVLGVLRTLELLASDRYYGVEQRFSRVADFGYSKTADETFQKWGGHDVPLADIVRVIREFRPDVLIARFSGTENDGHGHHQASSILTQESFRAAADPNRFPEQIKEGLQPWQAKKLYIGNVCGFGATTCPDENWTVKLNTGEEDPVLGMSYVQFAIEGLRHQQSQGLGDLKIPSGPRYAFYKLVDSVVSNTKDANGHEKDLFDGIDTSLPALASRLGAEKEAPWLAPNLKSITGQIADSPDALSKLLRELQGVLDSIDQSELQPGKKAALTDLLLAKADQGATALNLALNLSLDASVVPPGGPEASLPSKVNALVDVSPGQKFEIIARLHNSSEEWISIQNAVLELHRDWVREGHAEHRAIGPGQDYYANFLVQVPADAPLSRPYWHRDDPEVEAVNKVDEAYQTLPLPPTRLRVVVRYQIAEQRGRLHTLAPDTIQGHRIRRRSAERGTGTIAATVAVRFVAQNSSTEKLALAIAPALSVALEPGEQVLPLSDGNATSVKVGVSSNLTGAPNGTLRLDLPSGWRSEPEALKVSLPKRGDKQDFEFHVFPANLKQERAQIRAVLDAGSAKYTEGYTLVTREDLGSFYYFQPAVQHVSIVDVKVPKDLKVGYIMGAGDDIPTVLRQIGMNVTLIPAEKLGAEDLSQYRSTVLGVRAYDTQKEVAANNQKLLDFVRNGGTLIVQNNNSVSDFNSGHFTPYPAELSRARVSVEEAPVQILAPDNPMFHYPNEISEKEFDGWVQERGLYFMDKWDDHFTPLLSCHDPNEPDQKGGLLVAKYGKGTYIYSGYAFFRQLPAGVPGAVRLFVNIVSAGTAASSH